MTKTLTTVGIVVAAWIGYALASAWWFGSGVRDVAPYVYAPLAIVGGGWLGHWLGRRLSPHRTAVGVLMLSALFLWGVLATGGPAKGPIGYANANAAVAGQLVALAGLMTLNRRSRVPAWVAVVMSLLVMLANQSKAAVALALPFFLILVLVTARTRVVRYRWPAMGVSLLTAGAAGVGLVGLARTVSWHPTLSDALDDVRRVLWNQAWSAFRQAEEFGGGPARFESVNTLGYDSDTSSAHSLPLQVAVELGGIGLALLGGLFVAGLIVAYRAHSPSATWLVAGGWTMLAVHSMTDHLMEYWPVTLAAGLVLGYGLVAQPDPESEDKLVELTGTGARGA